MIELHHGDCLQIMPTLPVGCADMILTDLPYGTTSCRWDTVIPFAPLWERYHRLIKPRGAIVLFGAQPFTSALVMSNAREFKYCWVWDKAMPTGHLDAKLRPLRRHEDICVFGGSPLNYYPRMEARGRKRLKSYADRSTGDAIYSTRYPDQKPIRSDTYYPTTVLEFSNASRSGKVHPTQKPVDLLAYLVCTYTLPGQTVLDSCMGSGSTGVACIRTERDFIGIEKDDEYFKVATERLNAEGSHLFAEEPIEPAPRQLLFEEGESD